MFSAKVCCFNLKQISYVGSCFFKCLNPLKCRTSTSWDWKFSSGNTESFAWVDPSYLVVRHGVHMPTYDLNKPLLYLAWGFEGSLRISIWLCSMGHFDKDHQHKVGLSEDLCQGPTFQEKGFSAQPIFAIFTPQHGKRFQYSDSAYKDWSNQRDVNFWFWFFHEMKSDWLYHQMKLTKWILRWGGASGRRGKQRGSAGGALVHSMCEQLDDVHITNWNAS